MSSIFLSHNRADKSFVHDLASRLRIFNINPWVDEFEILPGDSLIEKIEEGLNHANYVGAILSPNSVDSEWVKRELRTAINQEIRNKKVKVVPIIYKSCELPAFLLDKVYVDFTVDYDIAFYSLLRRLLNPGELQGIHPALLGKFVNSISITDPISALRSFVEKEINKQNKKEKELRLMRAFETEYLQQEHGDFLDKFQNKLQNETVDEDEKIEFVYSAALHFNLPYKCSECNVTMLIVPEQLVDKLCELFNRHEIRDELLKVISPIAKSGYGNWMWEKPHDDDRHYCWICYVYRIDNGEAD